MVRSMASGQPSPDEELTETVAPSGIFAAASASETHFPAATLAAPLSAANGAVSPAMPLAIVYTACVPKRAGPRRPAQW